MSGCVGCLPMRVSASRERDGRGAGCGTADPGTGSGVAARDVALGTSGPARKKAKGAPRSGVDRKKKSSVTVAIQI